MTTDELKAALIKRVMPNLNLTMYQRAKLTEIALKMEGMNTTGEIINNDLIEQLKAIRETATETPEEPEPEHYGYGERNPHAQPTEAAIRAWLEAARVKKEMRIEGLKPVQPDQAKQGEIPLTIH